MFKLYLIHVLLILFLNKIDGRDLMIERNTINSDNDYVIDLSHFGEEIYGLPDPEVGRTLENWTPEMGGNPEEQGSYLQGDILIPIPDGRNGLSDKSKRWDNGVVPFEIKGKYNAFQMQMIEEAINAYHKNTCIQFKPRTNEVDYIVIVSENTGCWSSLGRIGGRQEVNLQIPGCVSKVGTAIHELMHALGFFHEQSRWERDSYVTIDWNNIKSDTRSNFDKVSKAMSNDFGIGYDYGSVMHYSATAFSVNGRPTIIPKKSKTETSNMGQRKAFSDFDIMKINRMYNCDN